MTDRTITPGITTPERLSRLIRIPTISVEGQAPGTAPAFERLREELRTLYPHAFGELTTEVLDGALLMTWSGSDGSLAHEPAVLMAHQDVVGITGVEPATADPSTTAAGWSVPPFEGRIRDGVVWGRGALDDKAALACVLEAVDSLVAQGFRPVRDVVLVFGCDEEVHGATARGVAEELRRRGVRPWIVVDEGGAVVEGALPGVSSRTAMVGVSEKGTLDLTLRTEDAGGHASTPPRRGATYRLARAITRLEHHPLPARLSEPVIELFERAAPHAEGPLARVFARVRTMAPVLARYFVRSGGEMAALAHTTVAVTTLTGSAGANVLATSASANLNIRIAVGETVAGTTDRIRRIVGDPSVRIKVVAATEPSPVSRTSGPQWEALAGALAASHPDALLLPYVQLSASDSRWFAGFCDHVYRFTPFLMSAEERATLHGIDERIPVASLERGPVFYEELLRQV